MIEFEKKLELMSIERREKKDKSGTYDIITVLGDDGKTIDCTFAGKYLDYTELKKRTLYNFKMRFIKGSKFSYITIVDIREVK